VGLVGNDTDGQFIKSELESFSVDTSHLITRDNSVTSKAFIWVDAANGTRNVVLDRKRTGALTEEDISEDVFRATRLVHIDGRDIDADLKAARIVKNHGGEVSLDVGSLRDSVEPLLEHTDHFVVSSTFAFAYCGSNDPSRCAEILRKHHFKSCVVTCGKDGACGWVDGNPVIRQAAFSTGEVVDTTGAGDVYHGAYLFGIIKGWGLGRRMEFASAAAALKCRKIGGREGIPALGEVQRHIRE